MKFFHSYDKNPLITWNFGNFLVKIPSEETRDVIEFMND
jgi:hypothetical protein